VAGGGLDTALLEQGVIDEATLGTLLSEATGLTAINLTDFEPNRELAALIPPKIVERLRVVPLSLDGQVLHVACTDPVPQAELNEVGFLLGKELALWIAPEVRVRDWISALYPIPLSARFRALLATLSPERAEPTVEPLAPPPSPPPPPSHAPEDEPALTPELVERIAASVSGEPVALQQRAGEAATTELEEPGEPSPAEWDEAQGEATEPSTFAEASPPQEPLPAWTIEEAREALRQAVTDREAIKDVTLRFGLQTFDFMAAFAVIQGAAVGWDAVGEAANPAYVQQISFPLDSPSVFRTVALSRSSYAGPPPQDPLTVQILEQLGRQPRVVVLVAVEVKHRLVAIFYGDAGARPPSQRGVSDFILYCQGLSQAFQELILSRKQMRAQLAGEPSTSYAPAAPSEPLPEELPAPAAVAQSAPPAAPAGGFARSELAAAFYGTSEPPVTTPGLGWAPLVRSGGSAPMLGRAAGTAPLARTEEVRPLPSFDRLLHRLTGPEPAQRARAMAELARAPEASARALVRHFPGPTAWSRTTVSELPAPDELGPIPAALARLGRAAAQALAPLLDAEDADARYFALLTAGSLPYAELVPGVLRGLFDLEPEISSAARVTAAALKRLPRFDAALRGLRQELTALEPLRRSLAARAVGALHDREAVDALISLTGSEDPLCAQAAAEALFEITRANFGPSPRGWTGWWAENRSRRRAEWLVEALGHRDTESRSAAIEELASALGDSLGYSPEAPPEQRRAAQRQWERALGDLRLRAVD
jgi:hypothetical protein